MSLLRIVFGVLVVVGFVVGLAFLGERFPKATGQAVFMLMGGGLGCLGVWTILRCLRSGVAGGSRWGRYYERSVSPFNFWSYILLYSIIVIFGFTLCLSPFFVPKFLY